MRTEEDIRARPLKSPGVKAFPGSKAAQSSTDPGKLYVKSLKGERASLSARRDRI